MASAADLRRLALALAGTSEAPHFDRAAFRRARIFVTLSADGRTANFAFTPDAQAFHCLLAPEAFSPLPNAWGVRGWTCCELALLDEAALQTALTTAWTAAAPRKSLARRR